MAKKNLKQRLMITAIGIGAVLGIAGFGMKAKYKDNPKATITLSDEKVSLSKFYKNISYDKSKDDFYYSDGSSCFYFSELDDSLFQYKQHLSKIQQKPLTIIHDTTYVKDTSSLSRKYSLVAVNKDEITSIKGLYSSNQRTITINHFLAYDSQTQHKAQSFLKQKDVVKQQVLAQELQHDYNFINGITAPVGSAKDLIENMYHDEFIGHLNQVLAQYDSYIKTKDINSFSLNFMKQAIKEGHLKARYPLSESEKRLIANGIIKEVTGNSHYKVATVKNAVKNARLGNTKTFKENKTHQKTLLYKLYTFKVNGQTESFYPYFKNANLNITEGQIKQVEEAMAVASAQNSTLTELKDMQNKEGNQALKSYILKKKIASYIP